MFGSHGRSGRSYGAALRDLKDDSAEVRAAAAEELARYADDHRAEVTQVLIEALDDDSATVRGAAALGLADVKAEEATQRLIALVDDAHEHVRQMALTALGEIGGHAALQTIEKALTAALPAMRFQAVMAFPRLSDDRVRSLEVLVHATRDSDPLVRHIALRMAEELGTADDSDDQPVDPTIVERATQMLDDEEAVVLVAAAVILGRAKSLAGKDVLIQVATRELITREAGDEAAALELLGELGIREAIPALEKRAFERVLLLRNDPFAWQARVALAAMGHDAAIKWVLNELDAWNRERRCLAVAAAKLAKVAEARPLLQAMRGDEARADPDVVEEALAALDGS